MLLQVNCRGYTTARHMQPEPGQYSYAPILEAKTFMQPEQGHYAHHPGRFVYIKDEQRDELFSVPYEPVRAIPDKFTFSAGPGDAQWEISHKGIGLNWQVTLPPEEAAELWQLTVSNDSPEARQLSIYPCFTIGYMSWMYQAAEYSANAGGIIARCTSPYQKLEDYAAIKQAKDLTYLLHDTEPDAFECDRERFEGEGGPHNPDALNAELLAGSAAHYRVPVAALQYRVTLAPGESIRYKFLFGPAQNEQDIASARRQLLQDEAGFSGYRQTLEIGHASISCASPDPMLDHFCNHWLPRQVYYHSDINRLTTDPQTRNFLQDHMGAAYLKRCDPAEAFRLALSQQADDGTLPDGILLQEGAELKYINQVPHSDHAIWLPVCLEAYLAESGNWAFLRETVNGSTVFARVLQALNALLAHRDHRGLCFIDQGDWCDPMNMVGHKGSGVSGWLSIAAIHALRLWSRVARQAGEANAAADCEQSAQALSDNVNAHLWDGNWYARGITDDDVKFGISKDTEGRIYLNPQSWALLAGCADDSQRQRLIAEVESQLGTPYGIAMLAPAYTGMREDVGRLTQKFPGTAENGSIYNHAAMFYIHALYAIGESDRAFHWLRKMLPGPGEDDLLARGQLPTFVPNYYRGAWQQYPDSAGTSSQLFNTGSAAWFYRCLIEQLYGLRGCPEGLTLDPQLPSEWQTASAVRHFRGATFAVSYRRDPGTKATTALLNGAPLPDNTVRDIETGAHYTIELLLPASRK
ncbi:GH36-type glycosyl hydrolase domain-containing protein [Halioglobus maricola]|nr:amylo-alpha-1,6-glucosidase [Halioglobus maricola]